MSKKKEEEKWCDFFGMECCDPNGTSCCNNDWGWHQR